MSLLDSFIYSAHSTVNLWAGIGERRGEVNRVELKEGQEIIKTHKCKECNSDLVIGWGALTYSYLVKCSYDRHHNGIVLKDDHVGLGDRWRFSNQHGHY